MKELEDLDLLEAYMSYFIEFTASSLIKLNEGFKNMAEATMQNSEFFKQMGIPPPEINVNIPYPLEFEKIKKFREKLTDCQIKEVLKKFIANV